MKVLEIVGIILFIFGIIFSAWPNLVIKLNRWGNGSYLQTQEQLSTI